MDEPVRRRRRVRHPSAEVPAEAAPAVEPVAARKRAAKPVRPPGKSSTQPIEDPEVPAATGLPDWSGEQQSERGLRGLVGGGSSQVSVSAALRARDAARPSAEDLAAADRNLTIVRRYWTPH